MDNKQQTADWVVRLQAIQRIQQDIVEHGYLGQALHATRCFLDNFQHEALGNRLAEIEQDYRLMCDFLRKGFPDEKREMLYERLLDKLYGLTHDIELDYRIVNDPKVGAYARAKSFVDLNMESVKSNLEAFVTDLAMASLETEKEKTAKIKTLHANHQQYIQALFSALLFSHQWSREFAQGMGELLVSPTIDSNDAMALVACIMLGAIMTGDPERELALVNIYERATETNIKQRALVGWVFGLHGLRIDKFPTLAKRVESLLDDAKVREELAELQIQVIYCRNAQRDNEKLRKDIMPTLLRHQSFEMDGLSVREKEDDTLDDILNPDAADRKMEEMENSIRKMMEMRDQGVDIYFGGFSQMKRFSFFNTLCNWFMPFIPEHPQLQHIDSEFLHSGMVRAIMSSGSFCESDKYSFVLGTSSIFNKLPDNIKEMLNSGNVAMMGMESANVDPTDKSYVRRMYLQDLYRFFTLCDARGMFPNPFESQRFLFMAGKPMRSKMANEARRIQRFLLKQKMLDSLTRLFYQYKELENIDDMRMEARIKMRERKYLEAQAIYSQIVEIAPDDDRAVMGLAQAAFNVGNYAEAATQYKKLYERYPRREGVVLNLAISLINDDRAAESMQLLYRLEYENPSDANVKRALAWGYLWLGNAERAKELYDKILCGCDCDSSDHLNAGYCNWVLRDVGGAVELFKIAVKEDGGNVSSTQDMMDWFAQDAKLLDKYNIGNTERKLVAGMVVASDTL